MNVLILVETDDSYIERMDKGGAEGEVMEREFYTVDFNFKGRLLEYFIVDEIQDLIDFSYLNKRYSTPNTKETRNKFSNIINNRDYGF